MKPNNARVTFEQFSDDTEKKTNADKAMDLVAHSIKVHEKRWLTAQRAAASNEIYLVTTESESAGMNQYHCYGSTAITVDDAITIEGIGCRSRTHDRDITTIILSIFENSLGEVIAQLESKGYIVRIIANCYYSRRLQRY